MWCFLSTKERQDKHCSWDGKVFWQAGAKEYHQASNGSSLQGKGPKASVTTLFWQGRVAPVKLLQSLRNVQLSSCLGKCNNSAPPGKSFPGESVIVLLSLCSTQAKVVTLGLRSNTNLTQELYCEGRSQEGGFL